MHNDIDSLSKSTRIGVIRHPKLTDFILFVDIQFFSVFSGE